MYILSFLLTFNAIDVYFSAEKLIFRVCYQKLSISWLSRYDTAQIPFYKRRINSYSAQFVYTLNSNTSESEFFRAFVCWGNGTDPYAV